MMALQSMGCFSALRRFGVAAAFMVFTASGACAEARNYLGIANPFAFDGQRYELVWSSQPSASYTKQEFLPAGQNLKRYTQMLLVETVEGATVADAVRAQVSKLNQRKKTDPLLNMELITRHSTGEVMLDFILSARGEQGEDIVEWNAYRYMPFKRKDGRQGVALLGVSHRAYGTENTRAFLQALKKQRTHTRNALAATTPPAALAR